MDRWLIVVQTNCTDPSKEKEFNEWYDNVHAIYEFPTNDGLVRAHYQMLTSNSAGGYFERFSGTHGTLSISQDPRLCRL